MARALYCNEFGWLCSISYDFHKFIIQMNISCSCTSAPAIAIFEVKTSHSHFFPLIFYVKSVRCSSIWYMTTALNIIKTDDFSTARKKKQSDSKNKNKELIIMKIIFIKRHQHLYLLPKMCTDKFWRKKKIRTLERRKTNIKRWKYVQAQLKCRESESKANVSCK